jgi:hypothetical protein
VDIRNLKQSDIVPADVLDKVVDGVQADLDGTPRRCCDCNGWFDGPGPRCPMCVELRNTACQGSNTEILRKAADGAVDAIEAALVAVDTGKGFGDKEYENLWDAMIALKNELPKR